MKIEINFIYYVIFHFKYIIRLLELLIKQYSNLIRIFSILVEKMKLL